MAIAQISTLFVLIFSYWTIHVVAVHNRRPPFSQLQSGDVLCATHPPPVFQTSKPLIEDCHAALQLIPSGRLTFEGGGPPTWSIEPPSRRRKFLPAEFTYRTCIIRVQGLDSPPLPRSLESLARTMYYHVWPAAREAAERVLQQCIRAGRISGLVTQTLKFDGHGPYHLRVGIVHSGLTSVPHDPRYHVYNAETTEE
jgi:hypothetical protein